MKKIIYKILDFIFYNFFSIKDYGKLLEECNKNYEYISFDIFDTLIKRNVKEEKDIFKVVEIKYNELYKGNIDDFYEQRVKAEILARKENKGHEITIKDIYKKINYTNEVKSLLCELEVETEIEFCVANKKILKIYNKIKSTKKIIITSDMYLSRETILKILNNAGYNNFYKLYLSCELDKRKRNGSLFKFIIGDLKTKKILHIGDNIISDYVQAKSNGFKAKLIKKNSQIFKLKSSNDITKNILDSISSNLIDEKNIEQLIGYGILGPLLVGFCINLNEYVKKEKIKEIIFLARDAKIIKRSYEILFKKELDDFKYIYVSRRSSTLPLLSTLDDEIKFENHMNPILKRKKFKDYYKIIGINENGFKNYLESLEINNNLMFNDITLEQKKCIFKYIKDELNEECELQREYLKEYLENNGLYERSCLVDIGWKGTIQENLKLILKKEDITGVYYGIYDSSDYKMGYLYSGENDLKYDLYNSVGFFETLFLNNEEGTTLGYKKENGIVKPVLGNPEQIDCKDINIKKIQEFALDFVKENKKYVELYDSNYSLFYKNYDNFVIHPSKDFIKYSKNITFLDGKKYKLIESKSLLYYFMHPSKIKSDLRDSYYKIGFLKNLLKLNCPYNKILKILYKYEKRKEK